MAFHINIHPGINSNQFWLAITFQMSAYYTKMGIMATTPNDPVAIFVQYSYSQRTDLPHWHLVYWHLSTDLEAVCFLTLVLQYHFIFTSVFYCLTYRLAGQISAGHTMCPWCHIRCLTDVYSGTVTFSGTHSPDDDKRRWGNGTCFTVFLFAQLFLLLSEMSALCRLSVLRREMMRK